MSWPTTMPPPAAPATRDERGAERSRDLGVELVGDRAADVVRLDERGEVLA